MNWLFRLKKKRKNLPITDNIKKINSRQPETELVQEAADLLLQSGVIAFPTHCLYGLAAIAKDIKAVNRIFSIKQRSIKKPLPILIENQLQLKGLVKNISPLGQYLIKKFWPGNLTLIFNSLNGMPKGIVGRAEKIGIRQAQHPVAIALIKAVGGPITGTSANFAGQPGCRQISTFNKNLAGLIDLILDAGPLISGSGSTVLDISGKRAVIIREGTVPLDHLKAIFKKYEPE